MYRLIEKATRKVDSEPINLKFNPAEAEGSEGFAGITSTGMAESVMRLIEMMFLRKGRDDSLKLKVASVQDIDAPSWPTC